jgi:hypothetical protein
LPAATFTMCAGNKRIIRALIGKPRLRIPSCRQGDKRNRSQNVQPHPPMFTGRAACRKKTTKLPKNMAARI